MLRLQRVDLYCWIGGEEALEPGMRFGPSQSSLVGRCAPGYDKDLQASAGTIQLFCHDVDRLHILILRFLML